MITDNDYKFRRFFGDPPFSNDWNFINAILINRTRFLEIGVAEGRSVIFTAKKLFKPNTEMYCVDNWITPRKGEELFDHNLKILRKKYSNTFVKMKQTSENAFKHFINHNITFDFIYIDSEKTGKSVIRDFVLSFMVLNEGGVLMFDDYYYNETRDPLKDSQIGLNMVAYQYQEDIKIMHKGTRFIVKKIKRD